MENVRLYLESLDKMANEPEELKYARKKVLQNDQFIVHKLFDDAGTKKYLLIYNKNQQLLKIEEYHDDYALSVDDESITARQGEKVTRFKHDEIEHPHMLYFNPAAIQVLTQELQHLDLAQIYLGVKNQQLTNTEANRALMNYVHLSRNCRSSSDRLININQQLFKASDLWLDLSENIAPIEKLIDQYQAIEQNKQTIKEYLSKLDDAFLANLRELLNQPEAADFSKRDLVHDTSWKLAGAAAELLVADYLSGLNDSVSFYNLILPFDYGSEKKQNQIDNLLINESGLYCIEVKSKKISNGSYNFDQEQQQVAYARQAINHVHAVKSYLLQHGLYIKSKYIHPIILVMNRSANRQEQRFKLINSLRPLRLANLANLSELFENRGAFLSPDRINQISQLLQESTSSEPTYEHYNFLPKLEANQTAIEHFNFELHELNNLMSKLRQNVEQYYKVRNYQSLIKLIKSSSAYRYFKNYQQ